MHGLEPGKVSQRSPRWGLAPKGMSVQIYQSGKHEAPCGIDHFVARKPGSQGGNASARDLNVPQFHRAGRKEHGSLSNGQRPA